MLPFPSIRFDALRSRAIAHTTTGALLAAGIADLAIRESLAAAASVDAEFSGLKKIIVIASCCFLLLLATGHFRWASAPGRPNMEQLLTGVFNGLVAMMVFATWFRGTESRVLLAGLDRPTSILFASSGLSLVTLTISGLIGRQKEVKSDPRQTSRVWLAMLFFIVLTLGGSLVQLERQPLPHRDRETSGNHSQELPK